MDEEDRTIYPSSFGKADSLHALPFTLIPSRRRPDANPPWHPPAGNSPPPLRPSKSDHRQQSRQCKPVPPRPALIGKGYFMTPCAYFHRREPR
jgi:hypothetical protein